MTALAAVRADADQPEATGGALVPLPVADRPAFLTVGKPEDLAKLFAKMSHVLGEVSRVAKAGQNQQQSYRYATEADLVDEIRPLLAKHGIAFFPTVVGSTQREAKTRSGSVKTITKVVLQVAFCCSDTGAMLISTWHGEAEDTGDKSYWKAYTGTLKYAHTKTWMVSTGDDPENDGGDRGRETSLPQRSSGAARARDDEDRGTDEELAQNPPAGEKPVRTEFHTRMLDTIRERRKLLPDGYACTVGKTETPDLKRFLKEHWELIAGNIKLARKAASAVDDALKQLRAKPQTKAELAAAVPKADETEEEQLARLRGRYFALVAEKHGEVHDADRREFQERVTGKKSTSEWTPADFKQAIAAVEAGRLVDFIVPL